MYRYVDENGVAHFTDDIQKVPEDQRAGIAADDGTSEEKQAPAEEPAAVVEPAPAKAVSAPMIPAGKTIALNRMREFLMPKKKPSMPNSWKSSRNGTGLKRKEAFPADPEEVKAYNDAVFALKDRIAAYQKRCDTYETGVKALKQKMDALEKRDTSFRKTGSITPTPDV